MTPSDLRERLIEEVAPELAKVWPSVVQPGDSLILLLAGRIVDAVLSVLPQLAKE